LNYGVSELDQQTSERLLAARRKAVAAMAQPAYVAHAETNLAGVGRYISEHLHGHHAWMPTALVISAALLVLVVLQQNYSEPVEADALLLASDLPPEAYVDKGFDAWLENTSRR
jgi:zinc transporter ZupT